MAETIEGKQLVQNLPKGKVEPADKQETPASLAELLKPKVVALRNQHGGGIPVGVYQGMASQMDPVSQAGLKQAAQAVLSPDKFKELMEGGAFSTPAKKGTSQKGGPKGADGGQEAKGPAGPKQADQPKGVDDADPRKTKAKVDAAKDKGDRAKDEANLGAGKEGGKKKGEGDAKGGDDDEGGDAKGKGAAKAAAKAAAKGKDGGSQDAGKAAGGEGGGADQTKVPGPKSESDLIRGELAYHRQWKTQLEGRPGAAGVLDRAGLLARVGGPAAIQGLLGGMFSGATSALSGHLVNQLGKGMGIPALGNVIGGVRSAINLYQTGGQSFMQGFEALGSSVQAFKEGYHLTALADLCAGLHKWVKLIGDVASVVSGAAYILAGASFLLGLIPGCQPLLALTGPLANVGRIAGLISTACGPVATILNGCATLFRACAVLAGEGSAEDIAGNLQKFETETKTLSTSVGSAAGAKFAKNQIAAHKARQAEGKTDTAVPSHPQDKGDGGGVGGGKAGDSAKEPQTAAGPKGGGYGKAIAETFGFKDGKFTPMKDLREAQATAQGKGQVDYNVAMKKFKELVQPDKQGEKDLLSARERAQLYADLAHKYGGWAKLDEEGKDYAFKLKNNEAEFYRKWSSLSDAQKDNVRRQSEGSVNLQAPWRKAMAERMKADPGFEKRMDASSKMGTNDASFRKAPEGWAQSARSEYELAGKYREPKGEDTFAGQAIKLSIQGPGVDIKKGEYRSQEELYDQSSKKLALGEDPDAKKKGKPLDGYDVYSWFKSGLGGAISAPNKLLDMGLGKLADMADPGRKKLMTPLPAPPPPSDPKYEDLLTETEVILQQVDDLEGSAKILKGGMDANAQNTKIAEQHKEAGKTLQDVSKGYSAAAKQHQAVQKQREAVNKKGVQEMQKGTAEQEQGSGKVGNQLGPIIGVVRRVHGVVGGLSRLPGVNVGRFHKGLGNLIDGYDSIVKGKQDSKKQSEVQNKKFQENIGKLQKLQVKSKAQEADLQKTEDKLAKQQALLDQYLKISADSKKKLQQQMQQTEQKRAKLMADYQQKYARIRQWAQQHYSIRNSPPTLTTLPPRELDWYDQNAHH